MFPSRQLSELIQYATTLVGSNPQISKDELSNAVAVRFLLRKTRSVYVGDAFAVRFSAVQGGGFPNTVLGLSVLQKYDARPFVICILRPAAVEFLLANSTFLNKVSHSSHTLRVNNIRGTFLGSDIATTIEGIHNRPENFEGLFALHQRRSWEENLSRLVDATQTIDHQPFPTISPEIRSAVLGAARLSRAMLDDGFYGALRNELDSLVRKKKAAILAAARSGNVNVRGNGIEQLLTGHSTTHALADLIRTSPDGTRILVDVKTKLRGKSNPKAYNVEKLLRELRDGRTVMSFLFLLVDVDEESVSSELVSIFDRRLIPRMRVQQHWSAPGSRGTTQISGDVSFVFVQPFVEDIDVPIAEGFLARLIDGPS